MTFSKAIQSAKINSTYHITDSEIKKNFDSNINIFKNILGIMVALAHNYFSYAMI